ncbi:MAG: hypothetical protein AAF533_05420 [Acidobacteriota bacterium]
MRRALLTLAVGLSLLGPLGCSSGSSVRTLAGPADDGLARVVVSLTGTGMAHGLSLELSHPIGATLSSVGPDVMGLGPLADPSVFLVGVPAPGRVRVAAAAAIGTEFALPAELLALVFETEDTLTIADLTIMDCAVTDEVGADVAGADCAVARVEP